MHKKVAFIGSVGSGKTTIIKNLSTSDTLDTDVESSTEIGKDLTTVGIDYGHVKVDENTSLGLYGVPGQRKFSIVWDFVKEGLWAAVILVKNKDLESINELSYLVDYFAIDQTMPCVVGITHVDQSNADFSMKRIKETLKGKGLNLPVYTVDARLNASAELIMRTLIAIDETN